MTKYITNWLIIVVVVLVGSLLVEYLEELCHLPKWVEYIITALWSVAVVSIVMLFEALKALDEILYSD